MLGVVTVALRERGVAGKGGELVAVCCVGVWMEKEVTMKEVVRRVAFDGIH